MRERRTCNRKTEGGPVGHAGGETLGRWHKEALVDGGGHRRGRFCAGASPAPRPADPGQPSMETRNPRSASARHRGPAAQVGCHGAVRRWSGGRGQGRTSATCAGAARRCGTAPRAHRGAAAVGAQGEGERGGREIYSGKSPEGESEVTCIYIWLGWIRTIR